MHLRQLLRLASVALSIAAGLTGTGCRPQQGPSPLSAPSGPKVGPGLVFRVQDGTGQDKSAIVFLAGTIHLLKPADYPLPAPYESAWNQSRRVVMEITPGEMDKPEVKSRMAQISLLPEGRLEDHVSPATWESLRAWCRANAQELEILQRMQPWMAAVTVTHTAYQRLGYGTSTGIEEHFRNRLKDEPKPASGLETPAQQLSVLAGFPADVQEAMIRHALQEVEEAERRIPELYSTWRRGDLEGLHQLLAASFAPFPGIERKLVKERNEAWLPELEKLLTTEGSTGPTLVLVGAGHLTGPDGLVARLRATGWKVEQLTDSAGTGAPATPESPP